MSDLISRAEALDDLHGKDPSQVWDTADIEVWVNALPSAQPEERTNEHTETHACDCISRQEAIDALDEINAEIEDGYGFDYAKWRVHFRVLPAAQPERMRGTWIIKDNPGTGWYRITCSECGEDVASTAPWFYPNAKVTWDYCPNCGAKMREVSK